MNQVTVGDFVTRYNWEEGHAYNNNDAHKVIDVERDKGPIGEDVYHCEGGVDFTSMNAVKAR